MVREPADSVEILMEVGVLLDALPLWPFADPSTNTVYAGVESMLSVSVKVTWGVASEVLKPLVGLEMLTAGLTESTVKVTGVLFVLTPAWLVACTLS
jgi:hypothetical protein